MDHFNYEQITELKPKTAFTQSQIDNIKLLSVNKDVMANVFGSASYRFQKYPGDLDLFETFFDCCTADEVIKKFARKITYIAKEIGSHNLHYFSEFKAGLDNRYEVDIGTLQNGYFNINRESLMRNSKRLFDKKLITGKEYDLIKTIAHIPNPGGDEYDVLNHIFREHKVLRWSFADIIKGKKVLPGGVKMTLEQALHSKSYVKIDMISLVNNAFIEVTNFFVLAYDDGSGNLQTINFDYDAFNRKVVKQDFQKLIKEDIEKLYYSNMYYSPFKMVKRIWVYSRSFYDEQTLLKINPLITGDVSFMYQLASQLDTMHRIYEISKNVPKATLNKQMGDIKLKLSNILEIDSKELNVFIELSDKYMKTINKGICKQILSNMKNYLKGFININTIAELDRIRLNPPPREFLPNQLKYANVVRNPYEIINNPLDKDYSKALLEYTNIAHIPNKHVKPVGKRIKKPHKYKPTNLLIEF